MQHVIAVLQAVTQKTRAQSVFLYGSRARGEEREESDWELGVLFERDHFVEEGELRQLTSAPDEVRLYPYEQELFLRSEIVVPFQRSLYLREIRTTGRTLVGEKVAETFSPPPITLVDLLCDLKFCLGRASDALVSYRRKDTVTAASLLFKSCIFATRDWMIFSEKRFPATYKETREAATALATHDYKTLVGQAYATRTGAVPDENLLLANVGYINKFVERQIEAEYLRRGNLVMLL